MLTLHQNSQCDFIGITLQVGGLLQNKPLNLIQANDEITGE